MKKWLPLPLIVIAALLIDQLSKAWIVNNLEMGETWLVFPALHPYLQVTRSFNTGIAFGIGSGGSTIFLVLSVIIVGGLLAFYAMTPPEMRVQRWALALVIGGALGNIIDRVRFGHVVDFVHVVVPGIISNVSNFADHMIVIGVIVLLIDQLRHDLQASDADEDTIAPESQA